ncbi:TraB/GumN family protein [Virgibacillus sp. W0430]|uniref:TraB/GumN family protein n=1 Tax=Virgibacillus sp. W0430 TaxID=3391580 RepID=UPI003F466BE6
MSEEYITRITIANKELILIGTAHVSRSSATQVREVIEAERPDTVCIELDEQRYKSITEGSKWKDMDIFHVIKNKKATLLLMNLAISSFQKRIAKQFGINPGQEMIQGIDSAKEIDAQLVLADRDIQTTFSRIWGNVGLWGKAKLLMQVVGSIFITDEITEEELEHMKTQDMLDTMLQDLSKSFPALKKPLVDERDQYLAEKIKNAPGNKIVAVVGAAHVPGIKKEIHNDHDIKQLMRKPPKSKAPKIIAWAIPVLIVGIIAYTFYMNPSLGLQQTLSWVLWNGTLSALGALVAFGHPLAILTAFVVAPISSLSPLIGAGFFAGFVQAIMRKPVVKDFESLADDVQHVKGFWENNVTRILLVVVLASLGSALGTFIAGADVVRLFLELF